MAGGSRWFPACSALLLLFTAASCSDLPSILPGGGGGGRSFYIQTSRFYEWNVRTTANTLKSLVLTTCEPFGIVITFRSAPMIRLGIAPSQLSLLDSSCVARDNGSHYLITVDFGSSDTLCGSGLARSTGRVDNSIFVKPLEVAESLLDTSVLTDNEDDDVVEDNGGEDDSYERPRTHSIEIPFYCEYPSWIEQPEPADTDSAAVDDEGPVPPSTRLDVYLNDAFLNPFTPAYLTLFERVTLYVQLKVESGPLEGASGFVIDKCYFYNKANPGPKVYLLHNGCPMSEKTTLMESPVAVEHSVKRFSFKVSKYYDGLMRLGCDVQACSRRTHGSARCPNQKALCMAAGQNWLASRATRHVEWPFSILVKTEQRLNAQKRKNNFTTCPPVQPVSSEVNECKCERLGKAVAVKPMSYLADETVSLGVCLGISVSAFVCGGAFTLLVWAVYSCCRRSKAPSEPNQPNRTRLKAAAGNHSRSAPEVEL